MPFSDRKQPGQPFTPPAAAEWNDFRAAAQKVVRGETSPRGFDPDVPGWPQLVTGLVLNNGDYDLPRFAPVALGDPIVTPLENEDEFQRQTTFKVGLAGPDDVVAPTKLAILLEPLSAGAIGTACFAGVVACRVAHEDDPDDYEEFADLVTGSPFLETKVSGSVRVLWIDTESLPDEDDDTVWATVLIGGGSSGGSGITGEVTVMTNVTFEDCLLKRYFRVLTFADGTLTIGDEYTND